MKLHLISIAVLASLAAGICAAEEPQVDPTTDFSIRVSLGNAPGIDEYEYTEVGTVGADDDGGARLEILAVKRWWGKNNSRIGPTFGGGIFFGSHSGTGIAGDLVVDISTFGAMVQGGIAGKVGNNFIVEVSPFLGIGVANNETDSFSDATGSYGLYGIKGTAFILLGDHVELGLEVGYEGFAHEKSYGGTSPDETVDVTYKGNGVRAAGVLAVKF